MTNRLFFVRQFSCHVSTAKWEHKETTARGFEPLRAEPNGFLVHHLNHSVTLSGNIDFDRNHNGNLFATAFRGQFLIATAGRQLLSRPDDGDRPTDRPTVHTMSFEKNACFIFRSVRAAVLLE